MSKKKPKMTIEFDPIIYEKLDKKSKQLFCSKRAVIMQALEKELGAM